MLRLNLLTTVIPVASLVLIAQQSIGWTARPCIVAGEATVELAALPWTADLHVAFTDDPARANLRIQIVDSAEAAVDFATKELDVATERFRRGLSSNLDVVSAETDLLAAQSRRIDAIAALAVARLEFLATIGTLDATSR